jgi:hypothetical protein
MIGTYLVHGWMHLFMVHVGAWLMHLFMVQVDVQVDTWLMHGSDLLYRFTTVYLTVIV